MRFTFWLGLVPLCAWAQPATTIDATQFFAQGLSQFESIEKTDDAALRFPWINNYELRTETRDSDFEQQEYTLRLSPSTGRIRKAQQAYSETLRTAPDFDEQEAYCDQVKELYRDWLSLYILQEHIRHTEAHLVILADQQVVFEKMAGGYEVEPERLLKLLTEKGDLETDRYVLALELDRLRDKYELHGQQLVFDNFITIEKIATQLATSKAAAKGDLEIVYKQELLDREVALEDAENKQLFDFVQLKYTGPHTDLLAERLSLGLGFQLSNSGSQKLKMQELRIEQAELQRRSERKMRQNEERLAALQAELQTDIQTYQYLQARIAREQDELQRIGNSIARKEGNSPLLLLEIEARSLALERESLKVKEDVLEGYVELLPFTVEGCQAVAGDYLLQ